MISSVLYAWGVLKAVSADGLILKYIQSLSDTALDLCFFVLTPATSVAFDQCFQLWHDWRIRSMPCLLMDWCQSAQTLADMAYSIFFLNLMLTFAMYIV